MMIMSPLNLVDLHKIHSFDGLFTHLILFNANIIIKMLCFTLAIVFVSYLVLAALLNRKKSKNSIAGKIKIAFFHPFCNDGGGGQKVLWCMVQSLVRSSPHYQISIYSLQEDKTAILNKINGRFNINILDKTDQINIVYVKGKSLLVSQRILTMVFHMILPILYALKCLWKYQPDVFYDTTGYASTLFITKILLPSCKTIAHVHYPFISEDMIEKIRSQRADFNNDESISKSPIKSKLKLIYYQCILVLYKINGYFVDYAQCNSTWTFNHMKSIWKKLFQKNKLTKLYPPCTVTQLLKFKKELSQKQVHLMSLAQFRPQKKQALQIKVVSDLIEILKRDKINKKLVLNICGTTRGYDDQKILNQLKKKANQLKISQNINFVVNQPFSQIIKCLEKSSIGIHTMEAEHFGISIVEMLASGLAVVAHNSAGPKEDIIKDQKYLAEEQSDYVKKIERILKMNAGQFANLVAQNRKKALKFDQQQFKKQFLEEMQGELKQNKKND